MALGSLVVMEQGRGHPVSQLAGSSRYAVFVAENGVGWFRSSGVNCEYEPRFGVSVGTARN